MNIQEQIEKSEEEFDELGAIFSFPHTAVNAKAEIPQRDGFPMLYNGMYITHDIKSWHRNSIKSILEGLVARNRKICEENVKTYGTDKWNSDLEEQTDYLQSLIKSLDK